MKTRDIKENTIYVGANGQRRTVLMISPDRIRWRPLYVQYIVLDTGRTGGCYLSSFAAWAQEEYRENP